MNKSRPYSVVRNTGKQMTRQEFCENAIPIIQELESLWEDLIATSLKEENERNVTDEGYPLHLSLTLYPTGPRAYSMNSKDDYLIQIEKMDGEYKTCFKKDILV